MVSQDFRFRIQGFRFKRQGLGFFVFFRFSVFKILGIWVYFRVYSIQVFLRISYQGFLWFQVFDLGFQGRVYGLGLRVFQVQGFRLRILPSFSKVQGFGFFRFRIQGLGFLFYFQGLAFTIQGFIVFRVQSFFDLGVFNGLVYLRVIQGLGFRA